MWILYLAERIHACIKTLVRDHWPFAWLVLFALLVMLLAVLIWSGLSSSAVPD